MRTSLPLNETVPNFDSMQVQTKNPFHLFWSQTFWNSWLSILSMTPNFLFLFFNVIFGHKLRIHPRSINESQVLLMAFFQAFLRSWFQSVAFFPYNCFYGGQSFPPHQIPVRMLNQVNTDGWQTGFYWMSLISACIFNMNDSIFQVTSPDSLPS